MQVSSLVMPVLTYDVFVDFLKEIENGRSLGANLKVQSENALVQAQHLRRRMRPREAVVVGLRSLFGISGESAKSDDELDAVVVSLLNVAFNSSNMISQEDISNATWTPKRAPVCE